MPCRTNPHLLCHAASAWLALWILGAAAAQAAPANQAVIGFTGPAPHASVTLEPRDGLAPPFCPSHLLPVAGLCTDPCAGFAFYPRYHAGFGACVGTSFPQSETSHRPCTTVQGAAGMQSRSRQRRVYPARLPGTVGQITMFYDAWSEWSAWSACVADPPEVGQEIILRALICGPADAGYDSVAASHWTKQAVIAEYRGFGASRRCPEVGGFQHWLGEWHRLANEAAGGGGASLDAALSISWPEIRGYMAHSALLKREFDPPNGDGGIPASHALCLQAARNLWRGFNGKVEYQIGSGNTCRVLNSG